MDDPYKAFNFYVLLLDTSSVLATVLTAISAVTAGGFSECSGLDSTFTMEEYNEGGVNDYTHKFMTRVTYSDIVLKRGMAFNDDLWRWHNDYITGKGKRRDGLIAMLSETGSPTKVWMFKRGIPHKYGGPTFNAQQSAVAIERLEIAHEGLELISASTLLGGIGSAIVDAIT